MKLNEIKKEFKGLKNFGELPSIKKMAWAFSVITFVFFLGIIFKIVSLVLAYQFHDWLIDYANTHQSVSVKSMDYEVLVGPIILTVVGAAFIILGWTWITLSKKRNVSPKPVYFLVLAIILTVVVVLSIALSISRGEKIDLNASISDVDKNKITEHFETYHTLALTWVGHVFSIIDVVAYWFTWSYAKERKDDLNHNQHLMMP